MTMRILVGTLHSGENEFEDCCRAIRSQSVPPSEHLVISGLGKQAAHDALYSTFMERSEEFDLLVKVDADMVLLDGHFLQGVADTFREDQELDLLLIPVLDYLRDAPIMGVNVFRNSVRWNLGTDPLFTDMIHDPTTIRKTVMHHGRLAPAAAHATNPAPFHAFHWGALRGLKSRQKGFSWAALADMHAHFLRNRDPRLALAVLGASEGLSGRITAADLGYGHTQLEVAFENKFSRMHASDLRLMAYRSRLHWLLAGPLGMDLVTDLYRWRTMPGAELMKGAIRRSRRELARFFGRTGGPPTSFPHPPDAPRPK